MKFIQIIAFMMLMYLSLSAVSCKRNSENIFDVNRKVERIISLSPSISRQIIDLKSENLLVGVTSYCPQPEKKLPVIGTLIKPNIEKILMQRPDLVLYSGEDSSVQATERLEKLGLETYRFKRNTDFDSICKNYITLGKIVKKENIANRKIIKYKSRLLNFLNGSRKRKIVKENLRIAFFVSLRPLIIVPGKSYINQIIKDAGASNVYEHVTTPFPVVSAESLVRLNPDIIISMYGMADNLFSHEFNEFHNQKAGYADNFYRISNETIPFFTPDDYIKSVQQVAEILEKHVAAKK